MPIAPVSLSKPDAFARVQSATPKVAPRRAQRSNSGASSGVRSLVPRSLSVAAPLVIPTGGVSFASGPLGSLEGIEDLGGGAQLYTYANKYVLNFSPGLQGLGDLGFTFPQFTIPTPAQLAQAATQTLTQAVNASNSAIKQVGSSLQNSVSSGASAASKAVSATQQAAQKAATQVQKSVQSYSSSVKQAANTYIQQNVNPALQQAQKLASQGQQAAAAALTNTANTVKAAVQSTVNKAVQKAAAIPAQAAAVANTAVQQAAAVAAPVVKAAEQVATLTSAQLAQLSKSLNLFGQLQAAYARAKNSSNPAVRDLAAQWYAKWGTQLNALSPKIEQVKSAGLGVIPLVIIGAALAVIAAITWMVNAWTEMQKVLAVENTKSVTAQTDAQKALAAENSKGLELKASQNEALQKQLMDARNKAAQAAAQAALNKTKAANAKQDAAKAKAAMEALQAKINQQAAAVNSINSQLSQTPVDSANYAALRAQLDEANSQLNAYNQQYASASSSFDSAMKAATDAANQASYYDQQAAVATGDANSANTAWLDNTQAITAQAPADYQTPTTGAASNAPGADVFGGFSNLLSNPLVLVGGGVLLYAIASRRG